MVPAVPPTLESAFTKTSKTVDFLDLLQSCKTAPRGWWGGSAKGLLGVDAYLETQFAHLAGSRSVSMLLFAQCLQPLC